MKRILVALAMSGALLLAGCASASSSVQKVEAPAFAQVVTEAGVTVVDVRSPEEYAAGHLPGAVNINVEDPGFDARIAELDKAGTYAVYCHSGRRSGIATSRMADAGFTRVYDLQGGVAAWSQAGGQLVTG